MDFTDLWIVWLLAFVGIEAAALMNKKKGDTLSEHVWRWFSVKEDSSRKKFVRVGMLALFMGWLTVHFVTGK